MEISYKHIPFANSRQIRLAQISLDSAFLTAAKQSYKEEQEEKENKEDGLDLNADWWIKRMRAKFGQRSMKPSIKFTVVDLDDLTIRYIAISYTWQNSAKPLKLYVYPDQYISVTRSAMDLLLLLAITDEVDYIWIDALCINQEEDSDEKRSQLGLMYEVFSKAYEVIAWTGLNPTEGHIALELINDLFKAITQIQSRKMSMSLSNITNAGGCQWPSPRWSALTKLLRQPFFSRAWIIQEMVSGSYVRLLCNAFDLDLEKLLFVVSQVQGTKVCDLFRCETDYLSAISTLRAGLQLGIRHPLSYVLTTFRGCGSTKRRDKIYALLNISSDLGKPFPTPDYNKSLETVFTDFAEYMLLKSDSRLQVLCSAGIGHSRALDKLPSWVPDWTVTVGCMTFGSRPEDSERFSLKVFSACGDSIRSNSTLRVQNGNSVILKGRIIDKVKSCHPGVPPPDKDVPIRFIVNICKWLVDIYKIFPSNYLYPTGEAFFPKAMSEILVAGNCDDNGFILRENNADQLVNFWATQLLPVTPNLELFVGIPGLVWERTCAVLHANSLCNVHSLLPLYQTQVDEHKTFLEGVFHDREQFMPRIKRRRKIFATQEGYAGQGPLLMGDNDLVCLLYGAEVPFLIRERTDGGYMLVGECFIHGYMDGEGMSVGVEDDITLY